MKTVIPFVFWSAFYIVFRLFRGELKITSAAQLIDYILNNRYEPIYWFFVPLFAAYAALPVLSLLAEDKYRKYLWYMVGMAFLTKSLIPIFTLAKISYNAFFEFPLTGNGFLMFVILGYLLSTEKEIKRKVRYVIYALGVLAVIIRYTGTYVLSMHDHTLNRAFFGYIYFTSVFLAVAVFVLFRQIKWERFFNTPIALKVIAYIASCSFGIYLIHYLVIINFKAAFGITGYGIRWRLIGPFVIYFIAFTIISILKKIPFLKHMVP